MRLEVTRSSDLAARALVLLSTSDTRRKGSALAADLDSTAGYLSQVMTPLVKAGWVRSDPGPSGGYSLAADLKSISVLDVIEAVEGPTDNGQCVLQNRPCGESGPCTLHEAWSNARSQLVSKLASTPMSNIPSPTEGPHSTKPKGTK